MIQVIFNLLYYLKEVGDGKKYFKIHDDEPENSVLFWRKGKSGRIEKRTYINVYIGIKFNEEIYVISSEVI